MDHRDEGILLDEDEAKRRGLEYTLDHRGRVATASHQSPFLIDKLLAGEVITEDQHRDGVRFMAMRAVFLRPVATLKTVIAYETQPDGLPPPEFPIEDADYLKVRRGIGNSRHLTIVTEACRDPADFDVYYRLHQLRAEVSEAFDALGRSIAALWTEKKRKRDEEAG